MTYAVHHLDAAGSPQLEEFPALDASLARVEALRNDGAVSEVRVFKEIPIEVRTYYRVVALDDATAPEAVAPAPEPELVAAVPEPEVSAPEHAPAAAEWQRQEPVLDEPRPEEHRPHVAMEPPSGAMVMGPTPVSAVREAAEPLPEPANEHRRPLFGRS